MGNALPFVIVVLAVLFLVVRCDVNEAVQRSRSTPADHQPLAEESP